jgi:hypothetical protein
MFLFLVGRVTSRKARLFGVGCCRLAWPEFRDERTHRLVDVSERFADGAATVAELRSAAEAALAAERDAAQQADSDEGRAAWFAADAAVALSGTGEWDAYDAAHAGIKLAAVLRQARQADLVRDLFNNPFHPLPPAKERKQWQARWDRLLAWEGGTVPKLARAIYDERAFERLPLLADALEEAGCEEPAIISHCRQPGAHVRGCWLVDLVLGLK